MKITYNDATYDVFVLDDGTPDTVLSIDNIEHRFDGENKGKLTYQGIKELAIKAIDNTPFH